MKSIKVLGTVLAIGLGLSAVTTAGDVHAQGKGKAKKEAPAPAPAQTPTTKKPITIMVGVSWGMTVKQVAEAVDKVLDEDYKPLYKKVSPGVKMKALDAQLIEDKSAFRRSRIDFGKLPTGVDSTPLKGEYTYLNKESMMTLTRNGHAKHFFFIQDKLWKIIDDVKLTESSSVGKDFPEAVTKFAKVYGVPGRILEADYEKGRNATEVDWKDGNTHLRVIQRGETAIAVAYEDMTTLGMLDSLRTNKPVATDAIDPAVAAAVRGRAPEPPAPPAPPDKNVGKKK